MSLKVEESLENAKDDDPITAKLRKTGCLSHHYAVLVGKFTLYMFNNFLHYKNIFSRSIAWQTIRIGASVKKKCTLSVTACQHMKKARL